MSSVPEQPTLSSDEPPRQKPRFESKWENNDLLTTAATATPRMGRWGQTPSQTPSQLGGDGLMATPTMYVNAVTPSLASLSMATPHMPFQSHEATELEVEILRLRKEWERKNAPFDDAKLDAMFPSDYEIVPVPVNYRPLDFDVPTFVEEARANLDAKAKKIDLMAHKMDPQGTSQLILEIPDSLGDGMPVMTKMQDARVFQILLQHHKTPDDKLPAKTLARVLCMRNIFKVKNGDAQQRKNGMRYLTDRYKELGGSKLVFEDIRSIWCSSHADLSPSEKHALVELVKSFVTKLPLTDISDLSRDILCTFEPLLKDLNPSLREDGRETLSCLMKKIDVKGVFQCIHDDCLSRDKDIRELTAKVIALAAHSLGCKAALEMVEAIINGKDLLADTMGNAQHTAARAIHEMAILLHHGLVKNLPRVANCLASLLSSNSNRVKGDAALALTHVADACNPYGIDDLGPFMRVVCVECHRGGNVPNFLRAFGSMIPLMNDSDAQKYTGEIMTTLQNQFKTPDTDLQRVIINVIKKCVEAHGVTKDFIRDRIVPPFFEDIWGSSRVGTDTRSYRAIVEATTRIGQKVGCEVVLKYLVRFFHDDNDNVHRMTLESIHRCVSAAKGTLGVPDSIIEQVLVGAATGMQSFSSDNQEEFRRVSRAALECFIEVFNSMESRLSDSHIRRVMQIAKEQKDHPDETMRCQAIELFRRVALTIKTYKGKLHLEVYGESMFDVVRNASEPLVIAEALKCIRVIVEALGPEGFKPSAKEVMSQLCRYTIGNHNNAVQLQCLELISYLAENAGRTKDGKPLFNNTDLQHVALGEERRGLVYLLGSQSSEIRKACARAFGVIVTKTPPLLIVHKLVQTFAQNDRDLRVCTAIALALIARNTGAFLVIPFIVNEYRQAEGSPCANIIQHAILKTIRYIFEYAGSLGKDYVFPLIPLLERALTERSIQHRRMAAEACKALVMAIAGQDGFQEIVTHLLNFVHPNIVELLAKNQEFKLIPEDRIMLIISVVEFYEASRLVLGSAAVLPYLTQGLFHAAQKIRDIYRRTYNIVYHASPEALAQSYLNLEDSECLRLKRHELYLMA